MNRYKLKSVENKGNIFTIYIIEDFQGEESQKGKVINTIYNLMKDKDLWIKDFIIEKCTTEKDIYIANSKRYLPNEFRQMKVKGIIKVIAVKKTKQKINKTDIINYINENL